MALKTDPAPKLSPSTLSTTGASNVTPPATEAPVVAPSVVAEEPEVKAEEPEVKAEEPEVKAEEPEVKAEEPEVKAEEPEVKKPELYIAVIPVVHPDQKVYLHDAPQEIRIDNWWQCQIDAKIVKRVQ